MISVVAVFSTELGGRLQNFGFVHEDWVACLNTAVPCWCSSYDP